MSETCDQSSSAVSPVTVPPSGGSPAAVRLTPGGRRLMGPRDLLTLDPPTFTPAAGKPLNLRRGMRLLPLRNVS